MPPNTRPTVRTGGECITAHFSGWRQSASCSPWSFTSSRTTCLFGRGKRPGNPSPQSRHELFARLVDCSRSVRASCTGHIPTFGISCAISLKRNAMSRSDRHTGLGGLTVGKFRPVSPSITLCLPSTASLPPRITPRPSIRKISPGPRLRNRRPTPQRHRPRLPLLRPWMWITTATASKPSHQAPFLVPRNFRWVAEKGLA